MIRPKRVVTAIGEEFDWRLMKSVFGQADSAIWERANRSVLAMRRARRQRVLPAR